MGKSPMRRRANVFMMLKKPDEIVGDELVMGLRSVSVRSNTLADSSRNNVKSTEQCDKERGIKDTERVKEQSLGRGVVRSGTTSAVVGGKLTVVGDVQSEVGGHERHLQVVPGAVPLMLRVVRATPFLGVSLPASRAGDRQLFLQVVQLQLLQTLFPLGL
uniref:Uncharacterized protein n=1 Tax=Timema poppense TaxID=170557 RepID=A0A7R9DMB4_TIMPO|nr:unnamed protein product [Timema poppensis]